MQYVNIPENLPKNVSHTTFFSHLYNHDSGYCIYLPADYEINVKSYPVHYHFHGWQGDECLEISIMESVYQNSDAIFVFPNISLELCDEKDLPVEQMIFEELIPQIEQNYRVTSEKTVSGFSMGGGMAVWFALKHPHVFSDVIAYAGTFHHYYHKDYMTPFVSVEKAERCLQKVGFGERYAEMAQGLETPIYKNFDDEGVNVSGGEAQKIALARALYKDAPFIILDEPTAALDPIAEAEIYAKFDEIVGDKTAIYISHRLSSCRFCDKIAVFDNGEIVQVGSHEELLADENGKYYELWMAQAQYYTK